MSISSYAASRLAKAYNHPFGEQVTAYLTDAVIVSCCGFGVMHRHVKAEPSGRFQDGHRLRTSDILRAEMHGPFWVAFTWLPASTRSAVGSHFSRSSDCVKKAYT
jgi:hypothetical protein